MEMTEERVIDPIPPRLRAATLTNMQNDRLRDLGIRFPTTWRDGGCPTCHGQGYILWYADPEERDPSNVARWRCRCPEQWQANKLLTWAGVGDHFQRLGWVDATGMPDNLRTEVRSWLARSQDYVHNGYGLLLHGSEGTGKTMAANLAAKGLLADGHDPYVITLTRAIETFTGGWRDRSDRDWFRDRVLNAQILVLDDMGRERHGGWDVVRAALDDLLRHRLNAGLATIVTSNLDPKDEISSKYDRFVRSLLHERSKQVEVRATDWRPEATVRTGEELSRGLRRPIVFG